MSTKEGGDPKSAMAITARKPDLPKKAGRSQPKRKAATPADSKKEHTPSKQRRTEGVKMVAAKPKSARKLIRSATPSESSTSAKDSQPQSGKAEDILFEAAAMADVVEEVSTAGDRGDSGSLHAKSGTSPPSATKTSSVDVVVVDDVLEDELLAKLDMLADPAIKPKSAADKGKSVMEEKPEVDAPSQEEINVAMLTMQELIDGDPSHFCQVSKQQAAFQAAGVLNRAPHLSSAQRRFWADFATIYTYFSSKFLQFERKVAVAESVKKTVADGTAAIFKKKEDFLAAKDAHTTQAKHLQSLKEEISSLEARLEELRLQVPLVEQAERSLAEKRNQLRMDMEADLNTVSEIRNKLPSLTASADEAAEELQRMRAEWKGWQGTLWLICFHMLVFMLCWLNLAHCGA